GTETGNGVAPEPGFDVVGGNIVVETAPGNSTFTVRHNGTQVDTINFAGGNTTTGGTPTTTVGTPKYAWSKLSKVYHLATCTYVGNISPDNLQRGESPPSGKTLHKDCPK